jgi:protein-S-isoprenylcysteine O-methyltransferase Ste14
MLASSSLKRWIATRSPGFNKFYRLFYTLFAAVTFFYIINIQVRIESPYLLSPAFRWTSYPLLLAGLVIMGICVKKYFLSLSGIKSLVTLQPNTFDLKVEGIHRYVRHPLYLGTFIAIWGLFLVVPTASLLVSNVIIHLYTLIGIALEERKLVENFGDQYLEYRKRVPKLIPTFISNRKR